MIIHYDSVLCEISGSGKVESVLVRSGKTGETERIPVDGVFVFIGMNPVSDFLRGYVALDEKGYVKTDENMKTSVEGVFACGDVIKKDLRQIINACGEGATAATAAERYVEEFRSAVQ